MRLVMVGLNHRTAPVTLREQLAVAGDDLSRTLAALREQFPGTEAVLLSTCNRTELYVARPVEQGPSATELRQFLAQRSGAAVEDVATGSIHREQEPAAAHLFRVAAGLDSMVLGEPQILGQVKRAYEAAVQGEAVGSVLHQAFQQAIAAGKQVRHRTAIGEGNVSVGSVAVDYARQIFENLADKQVLSIGAGEMTKPMLRHLLGQSPKRLWLVNRTPAAATTLAETLALRPDRGGARPWEQMHELLVEADIVLTATGAAEPILTAKQMKPILRKRRNRPLLIVDLALPRDVEPALGTLNNVYLYNIDDLQNAIDVNHDQRAEAVHAGETHVNEAAAACMARIQHQDLGQLVRQLRHQLHAIGEAEQQRTDRKIAAHIGGSGSGDTEAISEIVTEHTHRVINKILHMPLSQLDSRDGEAPLGFYAAALRRLFHLEDAQNEAVAKEEDESTGALNNEAGVDGSESANRPRTGRVEQSATHHSHPDTLTP